ncbi:MAG: hypothetical protein CMP83_10655 [Gammaproteobacteria bacterium]|nr:hypothetical protein [Gammaproteobacteria bacterium]
MITFPDSPPNGTEIIDRQDDGSVIIWTYDESKNEWTYQQYGSQDPIRIFTDQVLVRDNHEELPAGAAADPSELKTQKDVNYFLNESGGGGGGGGGDISMKPWIKIERFRREFSGGRPNGAPDFYCTYDVNNLAQYFWCWEMDLQADGTWVDIDDMSNADQSEIIGIQMEGYLRMGSQTSDKYPNAKIRYRITAELNDGESELSTSEEVAYGSEVGDNPWDISYDPPLFTDGDAGSDLSKYATVDSVESLEDRVELIEKALFPYVEFGDRYCYYNKGGSYTNSSVRIYQYWSSSANGSWVWAWMVKMPGTDTWIDVDDMTDEQQAEIGYLGDEDGVYLFLYPPNEDDMPDIEVKQKVTDELEGFETAEEWSESFFPRQNWVNQDTDSSVRNARSKRGRGRLAQHIKG